VEPNGLTPPDWARVDNPELYCSCPSCGLFLPNETFQRDVRCPRCLRTESRAVVMQPLVALAAEETRPL
jgi:hypothetical protein